ncbi:hypothetical protein BJV74DRAFT_319281 [Russula compacta]|nr:hypothetical protein BJV74DRAFT_319281 [Russula compacta]
MRRIASVLSARHTDTDKPERHQPPDDAHPVPPTNSPSSQPRRRSSRRFFATLTRITVSTERPTTTSEPAHSSSASSTGSVSLRTPEDDRTGSLVHHGRPSVSGRKAWIPWLTPKVLDLQSQPRRPSSYWSDSLSSVPSPTALPAPSKIIPDQATESEEDTSEESSSSESEALSPSPSAPTTRPDSVDRPLTPISFLKAFTANNIPPPFSPPPLLHYPDAPIFPRSSNRSRPLPFRETMESTMHKKRLLHQLQQGRLTPADQRILAAIGSRAPSASQRRALVQPEEGERYNLKHVRPSSHGLKQWIARPYFEDRSILWVPDEAGTVVWTTVKGSGFGVWALEVSDTLELIAGFTGVEDLIPIGAFGGSSSNPPDSSTSLSVVGKNALHKAVPSPLRSNHTPSDPPKPFSSDVMAPPSTATVSSSRRGVRFAENVEKEDQVPLSYILRHRKRREEKILFLQREQERREHEEEKLRHESERQHWEQEKRQWLKEKRTMEDAKRQKQFAKEIAAARARREYLYALPSSQAREQDRKPGEAYSRPTYDPRRQVEPPSQSQPSRSRIDSSSSSKQGNVPQSENVGPLASRPASIYSFASSEDIRTRVSRHSKRGSMISESSQRSVASPVFTYGWPPVPLLPQVLPMPVFSPIQGMPMMPQFPVDMPLLPPAAPFMRQQYDRSRSRDLPPPRGTGQSRSAERPTDRASPQSRHQRSSSDDYGGRKSPAHSHTQTNNSLVPSRPAHPMHTSSLDSSHKVSVTSSIHQKPYAARRQTAIP